MFVANGFGFGDGSEGLWEWELGLFEGVDGYFLGLVYLIG